MASKGVFAMRLVHSVDSISEKADKYQDHGTAVVKLVSQEVRNKLRALRKELNVGSK